MDLTGLNDLYSTEKTQTNKLFAQSDSSTSKASGNLDKVGDFWSKILGGDRQKTMDVLGPEVTTIKSQYETAKKAQEAKKKQTVIQVKEVKIRPKTDEHDLLVKIRHIKRFLAQKDKAKVTILFRGREIAYADQGMKVLERIREELKDEIVVEQQPKMEGRNLIMILAPKS